jgi:putative oxidoreductase
VVDVEHALGISNRFHVGLFSSALLLQIWGVLQSLIGVLTILGLLRRWVYPVVIAINGASSLGAWRSIVDPWGWVLEGTNVLFFPSLIIFAASLLLWTHRGEDGTALDLRLSRRTAERRRRRASNRWYSPDSPIGAGSGWFPAPDRRASFAGSWIIRGSPERFSC